jgi:hypothetical protein
MKTIHGVEIYENLKETVDPAHMNQDSHDRSLANLARLTTLATSKEILACL